LAFCGILFLSATVAAGEPLEVHMSIYTGQEIIDSHEPYPYEQGYIYYYPQEQGTRTVSFRHKFYFDPLETGIIECYWKDLSVSGDQWHYFAQESFCFIPTTIELYSGSDKIAYQFVVTHYYDFALPVFIKAY